MAVWLYYVGRFLEAVALGMLLYALLYGLTTGDLRQELRLFFIGLLLFWVGRGLERWGSRLS
ncbi:MAG: hypothetical protein NZ742_12050 [Acidobacteria bacterium]|nr:hypothetical protein [Acidobacteriota bacterium]MDW7985414.1 hypothetical protein [Acidobacteriota bacterium]